MNEERSRYAFYKHLTLMECRKDIILQNDFINKSIKDSNAHFFKKYKYKIQSNKMRLIYLAGFCALFSLSYLHDVFFQSKLYFKASSYIFDRDHLPALSELQKVRVNYSSKEARQLGQYFLSYQKKLINQQITTALLGSRISAFTYDENEQLDVNKFVAKCIQKGIKRQDLPYI